MFCALRLGWMGTVLVSVFVTSCVTSRHEEAPASSAAASHAAEHVHWSYDGPEAPPEWGHLSPEYQMCAAGRAQSPVDLDVRHAESAAVAPLSIHYGARHAVEENNGHTIQDSVDPGDFVELNGTRFELQQFHFHHPSEHTLNGQHYPLEIHLVHRSSSGALLVVGVLAAEGEEHALLRTLFERLPHQHERREFTLDPAALLPANHRYVTYQGSLTTPPCTEGVTWAVLTEPLLASAEQIARFSRLFPHNNRPVMPLNGRHLYAVQGL